MKRFIIFTLIALFALSAFSCNTQSPKPSETTDEITTDSELTTDETTTEAEITTDGETTRDDSDYSPAELEELSRIYELTVEYRSDDIKINVFPTVFAEKYQTDSVPLETSLKLGDQEWQLKYTHSEKYPLRNKATHKYSITTANGSGSRSESISLFDDGSVFHAITSLAEFDLSNMSTLYDMIPLLCTTFLEWVDLSEFPFVEILEYDGQYEFCFKKTGGSYRWDACTITMNKEGVVTSFLNQTMGVTDPCTDGDIDPQKEARLINLALRELNRTKQVPALFFRCMETLDKLFVTVEDEGVCVRYIVTVAFSQTGTGISTYEHIIAIPLDLLLKDSAAS